MCRASLLCVAVFVAVVASVLATAVEQCPGMAIPDLHEKVTLTPCKRLPCQLRKGTKTFISLVFTPEKDIENLTTRVSAEVLGVPLPFIGVDGTSACNKIFLDDELETHSPCPLKAGTKYIYKDSFPILAVYPRITTVVQWKLVSKNDDVTCFVVPAKIV